MRWATQIVVGVAISFALVRPGFAQTASSCASSDAERSIVACTFVIDAGLAKPDDVAIAYYNRGNAYAALRRFEKAIEDYSERKRPALPSSHLIVAGRAWPAQPHLVRGARAPAAEHRG